MSTLPPISGSTPQAANLRSTADARSAAQRAFFEAALGRAPAAATAPIRTEPQRPRAAATVAVDLDGPPPARILRPGSLLDIKV